MIYCEFQRIFKKAIGWLLYSTKIYKELLLYFIWEVIYDSTVR